ncbi:MAG: fused MFS/spermidine synthase [Bryobacteraceae bacterium]
MPANLAQEPVPQMADSGETASIAAPAEALKTGGSTAVAILLSVSIFVSAFLLFSVQPLMGRLILPAFGGSASVWSACMFFFQAVLLLGYAYSDWTSRKLSPRAQCGTHLALLACGLLWLPLKTNFSLIDGQTPTLRVLAILAASVGVPYFLLSTTSPLVQLWYSRIFQKTPYRLYALSNLASLLALIAYPVAIEPSIAVHGQITAWSVAFGLFVLLCGAAALVAARKSVAVDHKAHAEEQKAARPAVATQVLWVALSAIPSALLLATTNHLSANVAAIPFLWVVPLIAYLLTLILCFDFDSQRRHRVFLWLTPPAMAAMAYECLHSSFAMNPKALAALFTVGLFIVCMAFHGELVMRKPHPRYATSFYLMVSVGGVVGGALIVWLAPMLLKGVFELPLLIAAAALFLQFMYYGKRWYVDAVWAATSVAVVVFSWTLIRATSENVRVAVRNFYGSLRVVDTERPDGARLRTMVHGIVAHGVQFQDPVRSRVATTYYAPGTGVQMALEELRRGTQNVGVIGLGAGTLAAYSKPGDHYVFYELNPQVIQEARSEFTYLNTPGVEILEGDGRLVLEKDPRRFDVLVIDAFSGDAIPTHLLTEEALRIYLQHLAPEGILAFHISNSVVDLESPVRKLAEAARLSSVLVATPGDESLHRSAAIWALMSRSGERLHGPSVDKIGRPLRARPDQRVWTDDYSNLFQLLKTE